ncbi:primosomal protein N' [Leptospira biflexa]|uniref:replication restart helicase PriA n=1 Tax=Leptospira biflexa TaxID=172 RepID=UPI001083DD8D|nr:primosomal protein N' [Leptospira biflexa]TGM38925.1 primosomal protein N' [Leptospira biflexa]TGM39922.1 primosomal protein N' [Leptospira biflexa]TGM48485.1 primosomal protein N' [Leptospira biflexa]TGM49050.1 primosomal protein N' [Leptospira biflexa]
MIQYAEVALNLSWESKTLTYEIPNSITALQPGVRVLVPLNGKEWDGVVIQIHNNEPNYETLSVLKQIDPEPVITAEQLELAIWMSENYLSSLGEALFLMVPKGKKRKLTKEIDTEVQSHLLHPLNEAQKKAYTEIKQNTHANTHLLYGITGSGKTEVYLHLMRDILQEPKGSVIFLVPEISLTYPTIARIEAIFPNQVAVLHSHLRISEKFQNYLDLKEGKKRICIGTRSAIFAPLSDLKLVVMDEEHDASYKENGSPRYHARQVALQRILKTGGKLLLGSATPSIELYYLAKSGQIGFSILEQRANPKAKLPFVEMSDKQDDKHLISGDLQFKISDRLKKKEQIILLLNRRGYNPFIFSPQTKEFVHCPKCTATLCYHSDQTVRCHLCGYHSNFYHLKQTFGEDLELFGAGTQKLEEYLLSHFPSARIERLDQDSSKNKDVTRLVLEKLGEGELDILTGTQMISKGLDYANVTLVGILNANHGLGVPDFRSSERTYALVSQVAGRAGRGEKPGEVIIQSNDPEHPVLKMAKEQNYPAFFEWELQFRKDLFYPPFARLARLVFRSKYEEVANKQSVVYGELIKEKKEDSIVMLGPSQCPFYKIDNNYRYHILLKAKSITALRNLLKETKQTFKLDSKCYIEYDLDPMELV